MADFSNSCARSRLKCGERSEASPFQIGPRALNWRDLNRPLFFWRCCQVVNALCS